MKNINRICITKNTDDEGKMFETIVSHKYSHQAEDKLIDFSLSKVKTNKNIKTLETIIFSHFILILETDRFLLK